MQKKHQYPKYLMSNGLLNLSDKFCHPTKLLDMDLYFIMC